jgi:hypothetical protein
MKVVKVLGTIVLSFLLLLSLIILGVAFTLHSTLFNTDFVVRQADKIDIPATAKELTDQQVGGQLTPEEELIKETALRVVADQQTWLKEQLDAAIRAGYDFFLGKTDYLRLTLPLRYLKQDLRESIWQSITGDPAAWLPLFQDDLNTYVNQNFPALMQSIRLYLPPDIAAMPDDELKPYLNDYLPQIEGELAGQNIPPEAYDLVITIARPYFDDFYERMVADVPDEETIDSETIPTDVMTNLLTIREYIGDFRMGYYGLIVFAVVMAGGIVLIWRKMRPPCLALGIVLIVDSALELGAVIFAGRAAPPVLFAGIPPSLNIWVNGFYRDMLPVLLIFSASLLVAGLALLVVSFLYRPATADLG